MRRIALVAGAIAVLIGLGGVALVWTMLFPPTLTENQRAILRRARAGLELYSTTSPTAASFAREVREQSQWMTSPIVFPAGKSTARKTFNVSVMSANPLDLMAFYLHPTESVCFIEASCDSLGPLALGLTYAHELQHRRDYHRGLITNQDVLNTDLVMATEARAKLVELTILAEYTNGRWTAAVKKYRERYSREPATRRRRFALGDRLFIQDDQWLRQEFGHLSCHDRAELVGQFLFAAKLQAAMPQNATPADSVAVTTALLSKK